MQLNADILDACDVPPIGNFRQEHELEPWRSFKAKRVLSVILRERVER